MAVIAVALLSGCAGVGTPNTTGTSSTTAAPGTSASDMTATTDTSSGAPPTTPDVRTRLAPLQIDDFPSPGEPYRRDLYPTWEDIDHDGCDAREQALVAQSRRPAQVAFPGCKVVAGDWVSPYDGFETSSPGDLDADHLVPLENVHESGGWRWDAATRRAYANDQSVLVMVSASANRSKGSRTPAEWRPPLESYWCTYATRWLDVKVQWHLTATTRERDALGQMLDTCPAG